MKPFSLGIVADYALTMKEGFAHSERNVFIGIKDHLILKVEKVKPALLKDSQRLMFAKNQVVMPGLINAHTHLAMSLFRGFEDDLDLYTWLYKRIFPLESKFVLPDFVKTGSELSALECLRFGTTTVNDMYYFPDITAAVWKKIGLRGIFSQVLASFTLPEDKILGVDTEKKISYLTKKYKSDFPRISFALGPHAPYTCDDSLLQQISHWKQKFQMPVNIHLCETQKEVQDSIEKYKETPVERLKRLQLLSPRTICHHSIHLSPQDLQILKESGTSVVYNPDSNMKLNSGVAPVKQFFDLGISVGLGSDGAASNNDLSLFGAMDLGVKIQKGFYGHPLGAKEALKMATWGGAKALGMDQWIGSIEEGKFADLIFVDLKFPHLQPINNILSHLVYSTQGLEVDTVLCDGKILMKNKKLTRSINNHFNSEIIYKKANSYLNKMSKMTALS